MTEPGSVTSSSRESVRHLSRVCRRFLGAGYADIGLEAPWTAKLGGLPASSRATSGVRVRLTIDRQKCAVRHFCTQEHGFIANTASIACVVAG
jgi:hypothetical protein